MDRVANVRNGMNGNSDIHVPFEPGISRYFSYHSEISQDCLSLLEDNL